jgi:hypothetical protein
MDHLSRKKYDETFDENDFMDIFVNRKTKKNMKTLFINTYWWHFLLSQRS